MVYQRHYWKDYDETKTETQNIEAGAVVTTKKLNEIELGIESKVDESEYTSAINKKADKSFVDSQFASIVSGAPKGTFSTLTALRTAYPSGTEGIFLVLSDGHWYYWDSSKKLWTSGGIYQAEKSKYSILPKNLKYWHTFKVDTTLGSGYVFNNTANTAENTENYFEVSVSGYGAFSVPFSIDFSSVGSPLYLRGTTNYRIMVIEYDENMKVIGSSQWANSIDRIISNNTKYLVFGVKRYDEQPMYLNEISAVDCEVLSDKITYLDAEILSNINEKFDKWFQGTYIFPGNGQAVGSVYYSNYRMTTHIKVNPSTNYMISASLSGKYQYYIILVDKVGLQIMNSGWVISKNTLSVRTPPTCEGIYIVAANVDSSKTFKDIDRIAANISFSKNGLSYDQYSGPVALEEYTFNPIWMNLSIGKGSDGKLSTTSATNRLLGRCDLKGNRVYTIDTQAPDEYTFNYVQVAENGDYLHDTYWQPGGARIKNDVKGYLYVAVYKTDSSGNVIDVPVSDSENFTITIRESTMLSTSLENRFKKRIICHRGTSGTEPENTLPAFKSCGVLGIWGCEMDVQLTKDNKFVIMHDETIDRTTTGTGKVSELTLAQIKEVNIDFGNNIQNYSNLKVPTLKEAIDVCRVYGTIPVLDIAAFINKANNLDLLMAEIKALGVLESAIILCQGTWLAGAVRQRNKVTPIIVQYSGLIGGDLESRRLFRFENAYCGGWNLTATDAQLTDLYSAGKTYQLQFYAITNDKEQAKKYLELGCDFISSDYPDILDFE
ncbi:glycerophosphodiester phosphodiesterase [Enterococcus casseliflavus]|uniref:glycerophosphodiester phosphodiesterase n=1 Tax=Enterococcus casseliflavus TaxID=37734 RepID=UPI0022DFFCA5|nr:glycerophosphodiester phosphodiesterase family protein [Enterococcus casseliflavus]